MGLEKGNKASDKVDLVEELEALSEKLARFVDNLTEELEAEDVEHLPLAAE